MLKGKKKTKVSQVRLTGKNKTPHQLGRGCRHGSGTRTAGCRNCARDDTTHAGIVKMQRKADLL